MKLKITINIDDPAFMFDEPLHALLAGIATFAQDQHGASPEKPVMIDGRIVGTWEIAE